MSKLLRKLAAGDLAVGSMDTIASPRLLEVVGFAGLDAVAVDMMFCPPDWETLAGLVRAGRNYDLDVLVRIPSFPWLDRTDARLAVDAARALGVGAVGVVFSCATVEEVKQVVGVSQGWHRDLHIHPFSEEEFAAYERVVGSEAIAMPLIESQSAIEHIEDILAVPGLKTVWLGMTDLSRMLGHPFDYEHPEVTRYVDRVIDLANTRGIAIGANVGYKFSRSMDEMVARIGRMAQQGVRIIWLQNTGYVIQWTYRSLLGRVADTVATGGAGGHP